MTSLPRDYSELVGKEMSKSELASALGEVVTYIEEKSTKVSANRTMGLSDKDKRWMQKASNALIDIVSCYAENYLLWDRENSHRLLHWVTTFQLYAESEIYEDIFTILVNLHPSTFTEVRKSLSNERRAILQEVPESELDDLMKNLDIMESKISHKLTETDEN